MKTADEYRFDDKCAEYTKYINTHINNVKRAWRLLQTYVAHDLAFCDDFTWWTINGLVATHDESKYVAREFDGYRQYFYPVENNGAVTKDKTRFNAAWLHHIHNNKHHWNHWVFVDDGQIKTVKMPFEYIMEMLLDWTAMSINFGGKPSEFYEKKKSTIVLHDRTRELVEEYLPLMDHVVDEAATQDMEGVRDEV